ncbi:MAG TPA: hypothetical protein PKG48_14520 [Bacteroidales bacterium]|nr:hypothetical protein [Bacteroidales bacterium]HPS61463.1 hypothetical protein [Bacteroidales bacterium]
MKGTLYIAALFLFWLLASGKSCDNEERVSSEIRQRAVSAETDSLRKIFGADTLSPEALSAFEESARLRLSDLFDYLHVLNDTVAPEPFRKKAAEMIGSLVISTNTTLVLPDRQGPGTHTLTLDRLMSRDLPETAMLMNREISGIRVARHLHRQNDTIYAGQLAFCLTPTGISEETSEAVPTARGSMNYRLLKHNKIFGSDTLMIWEVQLGDPQQRDLRAGPRTRGRNF